MQHMLVPMLSTGKQNTTPASASCTSVVIPCLRYLDDLLCMLIYMVVDKAYFMFLDSFGLAHECLHALMEISY